MATQLSVSISEGLMVKLDSLASHTQRSREDLVAAAVERLVDGEAPFVEQMLRGTRHADAGRLIAHEDVEAWIDSLGTASPLPRPTVRTS